MNLSYESKVGIFVTVLLLLTVYAIYRTGDYGVWGERGYPLTALFDSAQGIGPETKVFIAGVQVGSVESVGLKGGKAEVRMKIYKGVKIPRNSRAEIRTRGLVGQSYIDIIVGSDDVPSLEPGEDFLMTQSQVQMSELMNEMAEVARNIRDLTEILDGSIGNILSDFEEVGESLRETFPEVLENLRLLSEDMSYLVSTHRGELNQSLDQIERATAQLEASFTSLASVTRKIDEGQGSLGRLVNDPELVENLNDTLENVNALVGTTRRLRVLLGYRGEYQVKPAETKSTFSIRLQPRADKFYEVGLVNRPQGTTKEETIETTEAGMTTTIQRKTTSDNLAFNLLFGKRFYDFTFRLGVLESSGGLGIDYSLLQDHLSLTTEIFDFDKEPNPNLRFYADIIPIRYVYLTAGGEDLLNRESDPIFFVGGGLRFQDDDLKSLLGLFATGASARP